MHIAAFKELFEATPFLPFDIVMPNGSLTRVPHPEYMAISPDSRTVIVFTEEGGARLLDPKLVTELRPVEVSGKRPKKKP